jgi:hypothetical protein
MFITKGVMKSKPPTPFNWCVQCGIVLTPTDIDLLEDDGFFFVKIELDIGINNIVFLHILFEQGSLPPMTSLIPKGSLLGQEEYPTIWDGKHMHCFLVNNGHDHNIFQLEKSCDIICTILSRVFCFNA